MHLSEAGSKKSDLPLPVWASSLMSRGPLAASRNVRKTRLLEEGHPAAPECQFSSPQG
jgi:hypothetical protein